MLAGALSNVVWKNVPALGEALDLKLATFLISFAVTVLASLATSPRPPEPGSLARDA